MLNPHIPSNRTHPLQVATLLNSSPTVLLRPAMVLHNLATVPLNPIMVPLPSRATPSNPWLLLKAAIRFRTLMALNTPLTNLLVHRMRINKINLVFRFDLSH